MKMIQQKKEQGITLVALVVTIIVLLILAGVTISLVLGQAGIFSKAGEAKDKTTESQAIEKVRLAVLELRTQNNGSTQGITLQNIADKVEGGTAEDPDAIPDLPGIIIVDGIRVKVDEWYQVSSVGKNGEGTTLPSTAETTPYLPDSVSTIVDNTDLTTGLVVKDKKNNEWVWVEVPKSITKNSTTDAEIENALQQYVITYRNANTDTWYDGCGITETEYNNNKSKMLQSIKANGGFWIGRYEVGTDTPRTTMGDALTTAFVQPNKYPYNRLTCSQAQGLASQFKTNSNNETSLMYGVQWDLTCKYMEEKGMLENGTKLTQADVETDSSKWGNYKNVTFDITTGKYSTDDGKTYTDITATYTKPASSILLTTGASQRNKVLNIYDLAGNEFEWTLEKGSDARYLSICRGGYYYNGGDNFPVVYHRNNDLTEGSHYTGFRPCLYK